MTFIYVCWTAATLAVVGYALGRSVPQLMLACLVFNALEAAGTVVWSTVKQRHVPPALLGRVSSLDWLISISLLPLSLRAHRTGRGRGGRARRHSRSRASPARRSPSAHCSCRACGTSRDVASGPTALRRGYAARLTGGDFDDMSGRRSTSCRQTIAAHSRTSRSSSQTEDPADPELFGLWESHPFLPDRITIFRRPLSDAFPDPEELEEEIRITVLHELAHYFGIDEDRLDELGYS